MIKGDHGSWYHQQNKAFHLFCPCSQRSPSSHQLSEPHTSTTGGWKLQAAILQLIFWWGRRVHQISNVQLYKKPRRQTLLSPALSQTGSGRPGLVPQLVSGVPLSSPGPSSTPQGLPSPTAALRKQANNKRKGVTQVGREAGQQEQHACQHCLDLCRVLMDQGQNNLHHDSKGRCCSRKIRPSPGAKLISPGWWNYNLLTQENTHFATSNLLRDGESRTATAQPHRQLV